MLLSASNWSLDSHVRAGYQNYHPSSETFQFSFFSSFVLRQGGTRRDSNPATQLCGREFGRIRSKSCFWRWRNNWEITNWRETGRKCSSSSSKLVPYCGEKRDLRSLIQRLQCAVDPHQKWTMLPEILKCNRENSSSAANLKINFIEAMINNESLIPNQAACLINCLWVIQFAGCCWEGRIFYLYRIFWAPGVEIRDDLQQIEFPNNDQLVCWLLTGVRSNFPNPIAIFAKLRKCMRPYRTTEE